MTRRLKVILYFFKSIDTQPLCFEIENRYIRLKIGNSKQIQTNLFENVHDFLARRFQNYSNFVFKIFQTIFEKIIFAHDYF